MKTLITFLNKVFKGKNPQEDKSELTDTEFEDFISCFEKLILSEGSAHLELGILTKSELNLAESILKNYKKNDTNYGSKRKIR